jgi:hypothetical protein
VLFLLRPRQTYMPYAMPSRARPQGAPALPDPSAPVAPAADPVAQLQQLAALHESGKLTDEEFAAAKQTVLGAS